MLNFLKLGKIQKDSDKKIDRESPLVSEMINRLSSMNTTTVKEIMVPRIDVVSLPLNSLLKELLEVVNDKGLSRIPVYNKTVDDIKGILYVKDLFSFFLQEKPKIDLKKLLRDAYFIPESKKILSLLKEFQQKKIHLAVVVDEYGGVSGIVTLEDIIEEIVGEIQDEYDEEEELIVKISEKNYIIDSRAYLEDVNSTVELSLPTKHAETIGGFVFDLLGKIPEKNEITNYENVDFQVVSIEGNKINKIKLIVNEIEKKDELY